MKATNLTEYDVTYALKEWLIEHGWDIVAFNPPGSQGTFTIPNPSKDPKYRGQSGSEAPDIIAIKNERFLLIGECKPFYNEKDVGKLIRLVENKARMDLLFKIVEGICKANNIKFGNKYSVIIAKAHRGEKRLRKKIQTFIIETDPKWDPYLFDATINPKKMFQVKYYPSNSKFKEIVE